MPKKNGKSDPSSPTDLDTFESKLAAAQARREAKSPKDKSEENSLLGMAWRLSTELLVSVLVGMFLGLGIDTLIGTKPWGLFLGLGFGIAAGFMTVFRSADAMNAKAAQIPTDDPVIEPDDTEGA